MDEETHSPTPRQVPIGGPAIGKRLNSLATVEFALGVVFLALSLQAICGMPNTAINSCLTSGTHNTENVAEQPFTYLLMCLVDSVTGTLLLVASVLISRRRRSAFLWSILASSTLIVEASIRLLASRSPLLVAIAIGVVGAALLTIVLMPGTRKQFEWYPSG